MDNMQVKNKNSRSTFLKAITLGFVTVGLGLTGFSKKKRPLASVDNFKTISEKNANELIKKFHSQNVKQLKPEPPPKNNETII
jgi:hypothetical protein